MSTVRVGDRLTLQMDDLGHFGDGVGRVEDLVVFVPFTVAGDRALIEIDSVGKSFARARLLELDQPSSHRVVPPCQYFSICGGCQLQHVEYQNQLAYKRRWVEESLRRIGGMGGVEVQATQASPYQYRYRDRVRVSRDDAVHPATVGFFAADRHGLVSIRSCLLQSQAADEVLALLHTLPDYPQWSQATLRDWRGSSSIEFLVSRDTTVSSLEWEPVLQSLRSIQPLSSVSVAPEEGSGAIRLLAGDGSLSLDLDSLVIKTSPSVFTQVNHAVAEELYRQVIRVADLSSHETVVDLYCGAGLLSCLINQQTEARVWGIDLDERAIFDAENNAHRNGLERVQFEAMDASLMVPALRQRGVWPDVVIVDPPRAGCQREVLDGIHLIRPRRLIYISCHMGSWARDVKHLHALGWTLQSVEPFDMFPQTANVEVLSVLEPPHV